MKTRTILTGLMALAASLTAGAATPSRLEKDPGTAIHQRTLSDFSLTLSEGREALRERYPGITDAEIDTAIVRRYVEVRNLGDGPRMHHKSVRNYGLLCRERSGWHGRGADASARRIAYADSVIAWQKGLNPVGGAHKVRYRFTIEVAYHPELAGDTLRVWMPMPLTTRRQFDVKLLNTSSPDYIVSTPEQSPHRTIYFSAPAPTAEGDTARFSAEVEFITTGQYTPSAELLAYDDAGRNDFTTVDARYRSLDMPHTLHLEQLAREIVGSEVRPSVQSQMVFDWISSRFPWAGAREYSTIDNIPAYVLSECHGDCGQVALLYISLMRSLGVPARWESGWMLHPGELNFHDWAEVYLGGEWQPVDVSFGVYTNAESPEVQGFYRSGIDAHRLAVNSDICGPFYPAKRFLRSDTVDFQGGEVECSRGNLFYPAWRKHMELLEVTPIEITPEK